MLHILCDWVILLVVLALGSFLFLDEEPVFDPTDWNLVHIILFLLSLLIVIWDNIIRARYGQFVYKDQVLLFSTFSFWFSLENYIRLIVIFFCFHCLSPFELELVELVEVYGSLLVWYSGDMLFLLMALVLIYTITLALNMSWQWFSGRYQLLAVGIISLFLIFSLLFLLWDLLISSASSCVFHNNANSYYNSTRSANSYGMVLRVEDSYDWHKASAGNFVFRFEELYLFCLQLFNVIALYSCTFVWLFLLLDLLAGYSFAAVTPAASITFLGVAIRWLDHALWCFAYSYVAILLVGARVYLRVALDVNF